MKSAVTPLVPTPRLSPSPNLAVHQLLLPRVAGGPLHQLALGRLQRVGDGGPDVLWRRRIRDLAERAAKALNERLAEYGRKPHRDVLAQKGISLASIYWYMRETQKGTVSSNSRFKTVLVQQYSANLSSKGVPRKGV